MLIKTAIIYYESDIVDNRIVSYRDSAVDTD